MGNIAMVSQHNPAIQPLDPWKHGPAVLKLFAEDFGGDGQGDLGITDDFAPAGLVEIDDSAGFVWLEGSEVRGAITCLPNPARKDTWIIANLVTDMRFRRRGIGRALLDAATQFIAKQGVTYAALQVDKKNAAAVGLYKRAGFEVIGEMVRYTMTPKTMLTPIKRIEVRRAGPQDAGAIWRLAIATYPESLGFAEPLDLEGFRLKSPRFWQRKSMDAPMVFVDASSPDTGAVLVREESLDGVRRRFELRPIFSHRMAAALAAGFVVSVVRGLEIEAQDEVVGTGPSSDLVGQLAFAAGAFSVTRAFIHMRTEVRRVD